jgi:hypothetical protein
MTQISTHIQKSLKIYGLFKKSYVNFFAKFFQFLFKRIKIYKRAIHVKPNIMFVRFYVSTFN